MKLKLGVFFNNKQNLRVHNDELNNLGILLVLSSRQVQMFLN